MAYECTVEGQYYALFGNQKTIKKYKVKLTLPRITDDGGHAIALSLIKNKLLVPALKRHYEDYMGYRTHEITRVIDTNDPLNTTQEFEYMSKSELVQYINRFKLPVIPELYSNITDLRQAIKAYKENPEFFKEHQRQNKDIIDKDIQLTRELMSLNPGLYDDLDDDLNNEEISGNADRELEALRA